MLFDVIPVDIAPRRSRIHPGDYKYLAVDSNFDDILASFDSRGDLSKWVLSQQNSKGATPRLFWLCRIATEEFGVVTRNMAINKAALRDVITVRETSY